MNQSKCKTEHAGAKNGGGFHGTRAEAKAASRVKRRATDKRASIPAMESDEPLAAGRAGHAQKNGVEARGVEPLS